jgi:hypothetical protein
MAARGKPARPFRTQPIPTALRQVEGLGRWSAAEGRIQPIRKENKLRQAEAANQNSVRV